LQFIALEWGRVTWTLAGTSPREIDCYAIAMTMVMMMMIIIVIIIVVVIIIIIIIKCLPTASGL
jgi:hypothetical protein